MRHKMVKTYRTLIRYESTNETHIGFIFPSWQPLLTIMVPKKKVPPVIVDRIMAGYKRFHVFANLGADTEQELVESLHVWEEE